MKDGDNLYYISGGNAYIYSERKQGIIEGLSKYNGHISDLFISKDYYFINYHDYSNSKHCLYRVSRKDYKEEQKIEVETYQIAFLDENIYYVDMDTKELVMISAADFKNVKNRRNTNSGMLFIGALVADGQYIYIIVENNNGNDIVVEKITADLKKVVSKYDITNICTQKTGSTNCLVVGFTVIDNHMDIALEGDSGDVGVYHFVEGGNELTVNSIAMVSQGETNGIINIIRNGSNYELDYCCTDGVTRYVIYDANGNVVE